MPPRVITSIAELESLAGQEVGVSDWLTIDLPLIERFAAVTGDHQWIHLDAERCRTESPYGVPIAHGFLTLSLLSPLLGQAVQLPGGFSRRINYGLNRVRFPAAVPAGSRIRARVTPQSIEKFDNGVQIAWLIVVEVEGQSKPAIVAEWLTRLYR
jgi:acyl dehydratase